MVMGNTVCVSSPCVQSALERSISADEQVRSALYAGSRQRQKGWWQHSLGETFCNVAPPGLESTVVVGAEAQESHLGEIGLVSRSRLACCEAAFTPGPAPAKARAGEEDKTPEGDTQRGRRELVYDA